MENNKNNNKRANRWRECDVNQLAGHFHKFSEWNSMSESQFERLGELHLTNKELKELFSAPDNIESFDIRMGLDSEVSSKDKFTFKPVINVRYAKGKPKEKEFHHGPVPTLRQAVADTNTNQSARVPAQFKSWLTKNWMELDASMIDDVFTASTDATSDQNKVMENKRNGIPIKRINQRLHSYHFTENLNDAFFHFIRNLKKYGPDTRLDYFVLHLGVDMNKLAHKEMFSFSPVFEVRLIGAKPQQIVELRASGLRCVPEVFVSAHREKNESQVVYTGNETVYYEYVMPCPPTCPE